MLGVELMNRACKHFFLDEPTSGLDAAAAAEIMKLLVKTAQQLDLTVIASIHQPSSHVFHSFNRLLLLSMGRTAYFGPASGVVQHFAALGNELPPAMNPADYVLELVNSDFRSQDDVVKLLDAWGAEEETQGQEGEEAVVIAEAEEVEVMCFSPTRACILMQRIHLCYSRDPAVYLLRIFM